MIIQTQSLLRKITHIEALVHVIEDNLFKELIIPAMNTINSIIFALGSLRELVNRQRIDDIKNPIKKVN